MLCLGRCLYFSSFHFSEHEIIFVYLKLFLLVFSVFLVHKDHYNYTGLLSSIGTGNR
jgi:hypothetical protein